MIETCHFHLDWQNPLDSLDYNPRAFRASRIAEQTVSVAIFPVKNCGEMSNCGLLPAPTSVCTAKSHLAIYQKLIAQLQCMELHLFCVMKNIRVNVKKIKDM